MACRLESAGRRGELSLPGEVCWAPSVGTSSCEGEKRNSSLPPVILCGSRCGFKPGVVIPALTATTGSHQGSLGAKALRYFHTCPFPEECSKSCCRLLSPKGCCELLTSNSTQPDVPQTRSSAFQELLLLVATLVFSATLAGEYLDLPKCGKLPLRLL